MWQRLRMVNCHIYCKNEDHSQQTVHISENVDIPLKWHSYYEGPQRNPAEGRQSYQCRTVFLGKKQLQPDKWKGNRKALATVNTICSHDQECHAGLPSQDEVYVCSLPVSAFIQENRSIIGIQNFLGERQIHRVWLRLGVSCYVSQALKELIFAGNITCHQGNAN